MHLIKYILLFLTLLSAYTVFTQAPQNFGRPNLAEHRYTGQELFKDGIYAMLNKAENLVMRNETERALILYDKIVNTEPDFADAYIHRALLLYTVGRFREARQDYQRAIRLNPYIADLYGYNGKFSRLKVLSFQPEKNMAAYKKADIATYRSVFDPDIAEESKEKVIEALTADIDLDTTDYFSYLARAMYYIEQENYEEASLDLDQVKRLNPEAAIAYGLSGLISFNENDLIAAEKNFRKAIEINPDFAIAHYNLSRVLRFQGKSMEALNRLNKALELNDQLAEAYFELAIQLKMQGDKAGAVKAYDRLINLEGPEVVEAYFNRGLTKNMLGDILGAIEDIDRVIELENGKNPISFNARGNIHVLFGNYFLAIEDFSRAIDLDPEYAEAYYNRAMANILAYNRIGACDDLDESIRLGFEKAIAKKPYFCTF